MNKTFSKTRILVECALMIALATILSYIPIFKLLHGGSITLVKVPGLGCWRLDKVPVSELETIVMGK